MKKLLLPTFTGGPSLTVTTPLPASSGPRVDTGSAAATITSTAYSSPRIRPNAIAISPDGLTMYVVGGTTVYSSLVATPNTATLLATIAGANLNGVAVSPDGTTLYLSNFNGRIHRHILGGATTVLAGSGAAATTDGTGAAAAFWYPSSIAINAAGTKLAVGASVIRLIDIATAAVTTLSGNASFGAAGTLYRGTVVGVRFIGSLVYSAWTLAYFDEVGVQVTSSRIYETDIDTGFVRLLAGTGVVGDQSSERSGSFNFYAIKCIEAQGDFLIVVDNNGTMGRFKPALLSYKKILGLTGQPSATFVDGTGTAARLQVSSGYSIGIGGSRLFAAEFGPWKVREITNYV